MSDLFGYHIQWFSHDVAHMNMINTVYLRLKANPCHLSHRFVWCGLKLGVHVRQAKFLRVCQAFFLGVLLFMPHLLISLSHMR